MGFNQPKNPITLIGLVLPRLANAVSNARTFGNLLDDRYTVNALMILIASLYCEYGHTWNYFCPHQRTPDGIEFLLGGGGGDVW
jgi:hypothetical protein